MVDIGTVSLKDAIDYSYSGVLLRSVGIDWDLRKEKPYEIYGDLNFNIPTSTHGDCFSRYLLRVSEMRESCKIINQVLNKIKAGSIKVEDFSISSFKNQIVNYMENLIAHYKLYSKGVLFDQKEEYTSV